LLACAASVLTAAEPAPEPDVAIKQAKNVMAQAPLRFEANQGQAVPGVRYTATGSGFRLFLTDQGPTLAFDRAHRLEISLQHANRKAQIDALDRLSTRTDYYVGARDRWHTNVASYSRVRYREVYRGIDVVYYGNQNQLEYDFVLAPGADPNQIRMQFRGAGRVSVSSDGDLEVEAGGARLLQRPPVIYQQDPVSSARRRVNGRYTLLGRNVVGFRVEAYDRTRALVIDPVVLYCTYLGGTGIDQINAAKLYKGLLYAVGQTDTNQIPFVDGAYSNGSFGLIDTFLVIFDVSPGGGYGVKYMSYLGGTSNDIPLALEIDSAGVAYITGSTTSPDFPMVGNSFQTTGAGSATQAFVAKLDPSIYGGNSLLFTSFLGGTSAGNQGNGITVDTKGLIYVIGTTKAVDFPVTDNAYQPVQWGMEDAFVTQIDPVSGTLLYSSYLGGEDDDEGRGILVGPTGLVYFVASTLSTQFPMAS